MKSLRALSIVVVSLSAVYACAIDVNINSHAVDFSDAQPMERNGVLMVPITPVLDKMQIDFEYNSSTKQMVAFEVGTEVSLKVGSSKINANGKVIDLDAPTMWKNGRVYVPIRFFSEALGAEVDWKKGSQTAEITGRLNVSTGAPELRRADIVPALALDSELKPWYTSGETLKFSLQANPGITPTLFMEGGKASMPMTEEKPGFYVATYTVPQSQAGKAFFSTDAPYASVSYRETEIVVSFVRSTPPAVEPAAVVVIPQKA